MSFLDAAIGFSVVMAIFAGAVTTIVEAIWRLLRVRKGNVISVLKKLDEQMASESALWGGAQARWERLCSILNNPLRDRGAKVGTHLPEGGSDALPKRFVSLLISSKAARESSTAGTDGGIGDNGGTDGGHGIRPSANAVFEHSLLRLGRANALAGTYERVSAEHVARKFAEQLAGHTLQSSGRSIDNLRGELNRLILRFEALTSSMSAEFRRRSQLVSILLGILAALSFNINGLRIIDEFIAKPELSKEFSTQLDATEAEVLEKLEALADTDTSGTLSEAAGDIESTVARLSNRGIPVGWQYRPHCSFLERTVDSKGFDISEPVRSIVRYINQQLPAKSDGCTGVSGQDERQPPTDLLLVVFTGVLIGLGAPFWFDIAKRLSAVRTMFGGKPSDAEAKSGKDANGSSERREKIVNEIVMSARGDWKMNIPNNYFGVPDGSLLKCVVRDQNSSVRCRADLIDGRAHSGPIARWHSADIMDQGGIDHPLEMSGDYYEFTMDLAYRDTDVASVFFEIEGPDGNPVGEPWAFQVKGKKDIVRTVNVTIMMELGA